MRQPPYDDGAPDSLHALLDEAWRDGALRLSPASMTIGRTLGMPDSFVASFDCLRNGSDEDRQIVTCFHWLPSDKNSEYFKRRRLKPIASQGWEPYQS